MSERRVKEIKRSRVVRFKFYEDFSFFKRARFVYLSLDLGVEIVPYLCILVPRTFLLDSHLRYHCKTTSWLWNQAVPRRRMKSCLLCSTDVPCGQKKDKNWVCCFEQSLKKYAKKCASTIGQTKIASPSWLLIIKTKSNRKTLTWLRATKLNWFLRSEDSRFLISLDKNCW